MGNDIKAGSARGPGRGALGRWPAGHRLRNLRLLLSPTAAYFAILNLRANDGPYFPPPLLALLFVVLIALLLLPAQVAVLAWRRLAGRLTWRAGCAVGATNGVAAGLVLVYGLSASAPQSIGNVLCFVALGLIQGCATLACLTCLPP